ncbi:MAG TPA: PQQ-dependent sugar dehydrogenase, partial [Acetobacteraceae bacterium]|nr:PQQ-dependent sugar dehydrogenase [Acetobacteraceae bacterium]
LIAATLLLSTSAAHAQPTEDWRQDAPGRSYRITPQSMPAPYATRSAAEAPRVTSRPPGAALRVPAGFSIAPFAAGLGQPRVIRRAPNGDIFLAESGAGRIRVFRADATGPNASSTVFAGDLELPFGIAFWPPADPQYVYVAETGRVVRYPYRSGDFKARGPAEIVVPELPTGGHWTRDLATAPDGSRLYLSVGSESNAATGIAAQPRGGVAAWQAAHGLGAAWGDEGGRADVLTLDPRTNETRTLATGLRNCVGLAVQPGTGTPWCATNERDGLGDDLPPDYATSVRAGAFYGWPWYYIGDHEDPRLRGRRPDLAGQVTVPDVLIQAHTAPLGITFYDGASFPPDYRGDAFVALHGSWNRSKRTGYNVIRLRFENGRPTGAYEDFVTGFVVSDSSVWGRPVDVAVARDGSLLFTEDGNGTIWRVSYGR